MKSALLVLLPMVLSEARLDAGIAAWLPDGTSLVSSGAFLQIKDLKDMSERAVVFPDGFGADYPSLAVTREGLLAVAGGKQVITWNPKSSEWKPLFTAPEGFQIEDIACDPKTGNLIFVLATKERALSWMLLPPGAKEPLKVFNRRASAAAAPAFDMEGKLYFICDGDLWKGHLEENEGTEYILHGSRIWPLAAKETSEGTSSGLAAKSVLPFASRILVDLSRSHGSGWGNIVRVPNADAYEKKLPLKWEELEEVSAGVGLALSPDGKRAAIYLTDRDRWYLVEKPSGPMVPLPATAK